MRKYSAPGFTFTFGNATSTRFLVSGGTDGRSSAPCATATPSSSSSQRDSNAQDGVNEKRFHSTTCKVFPSRTRRSASLPESPSGHDTTRLRWTCFTSASFGVSFLSASMTPFTQKLPSFSSSWSPPYAR